MYMDLNKNKFVLPEEFSRAMQNLGDDSIKIKEMCALVYVNGVKIKEAYKQVGILKTFRSCERNIRDASNGLFNLQDLRRSYVFSHPQVSYKKKYNRKPIDAKLRWRILCRDNFRCKACGITSKETILHVDHIIPVAFGGKTEEANLRTLCGLCNMGKGTLILEIDIKDKQNQEGSSVEVKE